MKEYARTWSTSHSSRLDASEWLEAASEMASRLSLVLPMLPSSWDKLNRVLFSPHATPPPAVTTTLPEATLHQTAKQVWSLYATLFCLLNQSLMS